MDTFVYAFSWSHDGDDVSLDFPKLPEIASTLAKEELLAMHPGDIQFHASDAVITALHARMVAKQEIPQGDEKLVRADGFVALSVQQAMKLELYRVYLANCRSISEFSRQIDKKETAARRMLNLRHPSLATEIEAAIAIFGKKLAHCWTVESIDAANYSTITTLAPTYQHKRS